MTKYELTRQIHDSLQDSVKKGVNIHRLSGDILELIETYFLSRIQQEAAQEFVNRVYDESPDFPEGS